MPDLPNVDPSQAKAIKHFRGAALVLAGPGSGKTFVITQRIKYLLESHHVDPESILAITFTKAASLEMKSRFQQLMNEQYTPVTFGTFHAIYFQILQHTYHYDFTNIIRETEKSEYLQEILEGQSTPEESAEVSAELLSLLLNEISSVKNSGISCQEYKSHVIEQAKWEAVYTAYEKRKKQRRKIDFDDMVLLCYELLCSRPELLKQWQERYQYILIDEYQDINPLQYAIVKLLAGPHRNIFAVGDDDQSIYGFRGSEPKLMRTFLEEFQAEQILLSINYRSSGAIVAAAGKVIADNKDRFTKHITAGAEQGEAVIIYGFRSKEEETANILHYLKQYHQKGAWEDIAIIYRTNSAASFLAEQLVIARIPFVMKERIQNIYQHFIARDLLAYLRLACGDLKRSHFFRIMNRPKRYISRTAAAEEQISFQELFDYYRDKPYLQERLYKLQCDLQKMAACSPLAAIIYIRKGVGYDSFLTQYAGEQGIIAAEWVEKLNELQERAKVFDTLMEFLVHVDSYEDILQEKAVLQKSKKEQEESGVRLLTIHASKGLEYPVVILPDLNEGCVPHKKSILPEEVEEERRMFYVAMTRAKKKLLLFYIKGSEEEPRNVSRFLKVLLEEH